MARKYDIINRLKAKNEKPFVQIDEEHCYNINTSKTNVMAIMAKYDEYEKKSDSESIGLIDEVIKMALGQEALKYINAQDYTMAATSDILNAIMAGISDVDIEEIDKQEKKSKK